MQLEIKSASMFLSDLLRLGHSLTDHQLDTFRGRLEDLLRQHYHDHWFPERPARGSGYRCIRINHKMDPLIANAAQACGVNDSGLLRNMFPNELTLWIDPREVSYRIGENGSICVLYELPVIPVDVTSSPSSPGNNQHHRHHAQHQQYHQNHQQQHNNQHQHHQNSGGLDRARYSTCKDGARGLDNMIMDNRNMNSLEHQFTQYVSS